LLTAPQIIGRLISKFVISNFRTAGVNIELPNGSFISSHNQPNSETISITDWSFFLDLLISYDLGFAESYLQGKWHCKNMPELFKTLSQKNGDDYSILANFAIGKVWPKLLQKIKSTNSIKWSRKNIKDHYDLSNDFFKNFLDESMTYSSAMFTETEETLQKAQQHKLTHILTLNNIKSSDHILDIGSGWGSLVTKAVKMFDCTATGVTLSENQLDYSLELVEKLGLKQSINILPTDYRNINGKYDHIFSIEMLEAVGDKGIDSFFLKCSKILKENGTLQIQVITIPDNRYETYKNNCDFIQKYIFPGGILPSLEKIRTSSFKNGFRLQKTKSIKKDYVQTLWHWRKNLHNNWNNITSFGFTDRDFRRFDYYFAYCQGAFSSGRIDNYQLTFIKE
jgi:cyclopropane-fatty-acyl-phospholipid synthase